MTATSTNTNSSRLLEVNPDGIPKEMKSFDHWIVWRLEERDGKPTKIPYNPRTDSRASSTDSRTWATFFEALESYQESDRYSGIGFMLSSGDPFVLLDFDRVRDSASGEVSEHVLSYISRFENRYVEASPSGTGLHLITCGKLRDGMKAGAYEAYGQERFATVTGEVLDV